MKFICLFDDQVIKLNVENQVLRGCTAVKHYIGGRQKQSAQSGVCFAEEVPRTDEPDAVLSVGIVVKFAAFGTGRIEVAALYFGF